MTFDINLDGLTELEGFQEASREELRILLALISLGGKIASVEDLARVSGASAARCRASLVLWQECGVITECEGETVIDEFKQRRRSDERYDKPSVEVARNVRDGELAQFLDECARLMKKPTLSPEEIKDLEYLLTDRGVSQEYLLILIAHLCERRVNVTPRKLLTEVERLAKKGIDTVEELELYISKIEKTSNEEWEFRNKFEIYRPLSDTEVDYVKKWMCELGYDMEIISAAYGAATKTVSPNVPFSRMDRILTEWHEAGCKTVSECLTKGEDYRAQKRKSEKEQRDKERLDGLSAAGTGSSAKRESNAKYNDFDTEDALMAALKRSYGSTDSEDN